MSEVKPRKLPRKETKVKIRTLLSALLITIGLIQFPAQAATFDSVSHIHNIKVDGSRILLGTHEGLYLYEGPNKMKKLGSENFDVMGLAVSSGKIYASGHPNAGSKFPAPVGLISSTDNGKSWNLISLQGKVDFHMLEVSGKEIYGADSQSGNLMYSSDSGKKWVSLGAAKYQDIAMSSPKIAFAVLGKKIVMTKNAFKSTTEIKTDFDAQTVETIDSGLYASSGKTLYHTSDLGKKWFAVSTFKDQISVVTASSKSIVVVAGPSILISTDSGKTFK